MKATIRLLILLSVALANACVTTGRKPEPDEESISAAAGYNLQLGVTYMRQGQMAVALQKLEKSVVQDPDRADIRTALAFLYTRLGRLEEADAEYRHSLRLEPDNSSTLNNHGAFLCQRGAYDEAMASFAKALKDPLYETPAVAHTNAGVCARDKGKTGQAESYFRLALGADPEFTDALLQLADLSFTDKIYLQARAFMDRYMASTAAATSDALWLGLRVEQALGDKAAAGDYSTQLLEKFPDSIEVRWLLEAEKNAG
ncbi:MAG: type IV pilus biogenesis/stability protein PilW [Proteobacteria bacterium]|nr:type IV pilus biogenesis/stability protein PilW [Pseudomonadota bacterium]